MHSAGDRGIGTIFCDLRVCVFVQCSFMLETGGKNREKIKLQSFFVYSQTLWRRAKLPYIKM